MTFLLDNGLPRQTVDVLAATGLRAVHVGQIGMASAEDEAILDYALAHDEIIVTLDADFHLLQYLRNAQRPSVIRIRIEGLRALQIAELIRAVAIRFASELAEGALISIGSKSTRCHLLPLH